MENPHQHCCCPGKLEAVLVPSVDLWFVPLQTSFSGVCTPNPSSPASFRRCSPALAAGLSCRSRVCPWTLGSDPDLVGSGQGSRYPGHPSSSTSPAAESTLRKGWTSPFTSVWPHLFLHAPREGSWVLGEDAALQPQAGWAQRAALASRCLG